MQHATRLCINVFTYILTYKTLYGAHTSSKANNHLKFTVIYHLSSSTFASCCHMFCRAYDPSATLHVT